MEEGSKGAAAVSTSQKMKSTVVSKNRPRMLKNSCQVLPMFGVQSRTALNLQSFCLSPRAL
jgi:hypothetical protein